MKYSIESTESGCVETITFNGVTYTKRHTKQIMDPDARMTNFMSKWKMMVSVKRFWIKFAIHLIHLLQVTLWILQSGKGTRDDKRKA